MSVWRRRRVHPMEGGAEVDEDPPGPDFGILLEDGVFFIMMEDGSFILME